MATRCAAIWFVSPNLVYDPVENVSNSFEKDISKKFPSLFVIVDKQGWGNDELRWSVDNMKIDWEIEVESQADHTMGSWLATVATRRTKLLRVTNKALKIACFDYLLLWIS